MCDCVTDLTIPYVMQFERLIRSLRMSDANLNVVTLSLPAETVIFVLHYSGLSAVQVNVRMLAEQ
jgi:ribosomal protein L30E